MATRRTGRDTGSSFPGKALFWLCFLLFVIWAARNPADAAAIFAHIAQALNSAAHHGRITKP
jgi:hypothetical protein